MAPHKTTPLTSGLSSSANKNLHLRPARFVLWLRWVLLVGGGFGALVAITHSRPPHLPDQGLDLACRLPFPGAINERCVRLKHEVRCLRKANELIECLNMAGWHSDSIIGQTDTCTKIQVNSPPHIRTVWHASGPPPLLLTPSQKTSTVLCPRFLPTS